MKESLVGGTPHDRVQEYHLCSTIEVFLSLSVIYACIL